MENNLDVEKMLKMSKQLWEINKENWLPMEPEYGKIFLLYMIEEMGETISIIKKKGDGEIMINPQIRERFIEEMSDILMYYCDVLNRFDISAEEFSAVYMKKYEKNIKRNYIKDHAES